MTTRLASPRPRQSVTFGEQLQSKLVDRDIELQRAFTPAVADAPGNIQNVIGGKIRIDGAIDVAKQAGESSHPCPWPPVEW